jgi:threonine aldolase
MSQSVIDLMSDTVTMPTPEMKRAMFEAELGDDVLGVDPTADKLQRAVAEMLGKEAAIFMPSGTMTNQIAVRLHCQPGDEMICEAGCHIYQYEQAAFAQLSGVATRTVEGDYGVLKVEQLLDLIRPAYDHQARTRLVTLENTHNRGGGRIFPLNELQRICEWAHSEGLKTHLDGARLFNAVVASGISAKTWCEPFDTVSVCFSKGLGAPIGSALVGTEEDIRRARRHRKLFGGGMRQVGLIAAGALYALKNHIDRLADDHARAQELAHAIQQIEGLDLEPAIVDTNIVIFRIAEQLGSAQQFVDGLKKYDVLALPFSRKHVRFVTHMHISPADAQATAIALQGTAASMRNRA